MKPAGPSALGCTGFNKPLQLLRVQLDAKCAIVWEKRSRLASISCAKLSLTSDTPIFQDLFGKRCSRIKGQSPSNDLQVANAVINPVVLR